MSEQPPHLQFQIECETYIIDTLHEIYTKFTNGNNDDLFDSVLEMFLQMTKSECGYIAEIVEEPEPEPESGNESGSGSVSKNNESNLYFHTLSNKVNDEYNEFYKKYKTSDETP